MTYLVGGASVPISITGVSTSFTIRVRAALPLDESEGYPAARIMKQHRLIHVGRLRQSRMKEIIMKRVVSNMAGVVLEYLVKPGDSIEVDQDVVMLESMKMQIPVQSTVSGVVKALKVSEGEFVDDGDVLLEVE